MNYFFNMPVYRLSSENYYKGLNDYKNKYLYRKKIIKLNKNFIKRNTNPKRNF